VDLSALIFVALAVAWATYLIPKALRQHEDSSAEVEGFSARLRVLARREPVDSRSARLVVEPGKPTSTAVPVVPPAGATAVSARSTVPPAVRRAAAARAAKRRLRVVLAILLTGLVVAGLAVAGVVGWAWLLAPVAVLAAWLVACRLMVKRERAVGVPTARPSSTVPATVPPTSVDDGGPVTEEIVAVRVEVELAEEAAFLATRDTPAPAPTDVATQAPAAPAPAPVAGAWDPVPTTLPTYVGKEQAVRRSVRTIDLDATGVWTSGPLASDSALAREADAERKSSRAQTEAERRASGS
jgi:hypothetical protein